MDKTLPGTTGKIIVKKLILDQFLLTPTLLVLFFTGSKNIILFKFNCYIIYIFICIFSPGMSIMERSSDPLEECKQKFLPTFARSCMFWLPAQSLNFLYIPPRFRVIYVGTCSFIWVNILCWVKRQDFKEGAPGTDVKQSAKE